MGPLGLSDAAIHAFTDAMQKVVAAGMVVGIPYPSQAAPVGRVTTIALLHLRFSCGVAGDGDLPPVWEAVDRGKGST